MGSFGAIVLIIVYIAARVPVESLRVFEWRILVLNHRILAEALSDGVRPLFVTVVVS